MKTEFDFVPQKRQFKYITKVETKDDDLYVTFDNKRIMKVNRTVIVNTFQSFAPLLDDDIFKTACISDDYWKEAIGWGDLTLSGDFLIEKGEDV